MQRTAIIIHTAENNICRDKGGVALAYFSDDDTIDKALYDKALSYYRPGKSQISIFKTKLFEPFEQEVLRLKDAGQFSNVRICPQNRNAGYDTVAANRLLYDTMQIEPENIAFDIPCNEIHR